MTEHNEPRTAPASPAMSVDTPLFSRAAWARILPFAAYIFFIVLGDLLERAGFSRAELRWLYPVQVGVVAVLLAAFWRGYHELHVPLPKPAQLLTAIAVGAVVLVLWINLDAAWMTVGSAPGYDPRTDGGLNWPLVVIRILGAAVVVPVMEELFWRSFVMRWADAADFEALEPARVGLKGFLISSVLFGFEHNLWLAGIVAGVAYALLYMRHRNLWSAVLAHAVTNGMLGIWVVTTGSWQFW
ncbi:CAAX prenyl protease-related protein [Massilia sp. G4R7]|uniref:CAAX prenyl protease-related protein n=1 Tax=Massilia phyllostachyos TaxID=2898585 RepID=A0ABS8QDS4_9BURK|nr:CAAX prenyl protease-related protein [Massilia phyllostachyos]MCD2518870.1 CAAX prenyl protease-related protein [Massilia phyllostachyos]